MVHYRSVGTISRHRHTVLRDDTGALHYEELMGEEGFSSDSSLLYHRHIPSAIIGARTWELPDHALVANEPLMPRHLRLHELVGDDVASTDAVRGRRLLLGNDDVRLYYVVAGADSPLYRNAIGDECVYVESGEAIVETVFGALEVGAEQYIVIPRATTHRWRVVGSEPLRLFAVEANSHIGPPKRYLSSTGQLLEHAPYCERDLRGPGEPLLVDETDVEVYIKHRGASGITGTVHIVPNHPFDVVGWDGCLYPFVFALEDFMPITGKLHQPPPVHQVFEGHNFVICNFLPRKVDYHPCRFRCRTTTRTSTPTRSCSTSVGTTKPGRDQESGSARSLCIPVDTPTARSRARSKPVSARITSTKPASWSTPSVRCCSAKPLAPRTTAVMRRPGREDGGLKMSDALSLPSVFDAFFDDAAIFPPGRAPLDRAVRDHITRRITPSVGLSGHCFYRSTNSTMPQRWSRLQEPSLYASA